MAIHPTAVIDPRARLHSSVSVGPYAVIDGGVTLDEGCEVGAHVHLTGQTTAGRRNRFGTGAVIGGPPQDLRYAGAPTRVRIGDDNVFREHVTVHCSNRMEEDTVIGSGCLLMAHAHVGHNAVLGDRVILANGALLGGHAVVGDKALISGHCLVHQFTRVGTLALMQGGSAISKDLPPFCIARGANAVCGLNVIGLRRAGVDGPARLELRRVYLAVFRSSEPFRAAVEAAAALATNEWSRLLVEFLRTSKRGVLSERDRRGAGRGGEAEEDGGGTEAA